MVFASYADFRNRLHQLMDGDDVSVSSISTNIIDLIVSMGEQRVYRDVRSSLQDASLSVSVTSNAAALPSDCIQLKNVHFSGNRSLKYAPYEDLEQRIQLQNSISGGSLSGQLDTVWYSLEGNNIIFWPTVTDGSTILGRYIKRFPDIATNDITGNTFFARFPDLWLYAALAESGPYLGERDRLPIWEAKYVQLRDAANLYESRLRYQGSKLQTRITT
jgi:hypothetical protein